LTTPDAQTRIFRGYGDGFVGAGGAQKSGCKHGIKHDRDNNADDIDTNNGREMGVSPSVAVALGVAAVVSNKLQQSVCKLPQRLGNQMAGKST